MRRVLDLLTYLLTYLLITTNAPEQLQHEHILVGQVNAGVREHRAQR